MKTIGSHLDNYSAITVGMAAKKLNKSERQVRRLLAQGKLQGCKVDGPRGPQWLLDPDALFGAPHCVSMQMADCSVSVDTTMPDSGDLLEAGKVSQENAIQRIVAYFRALCAAFAMRLSAISGKA